MIGAGSGRWAQTFHGWDWAQAAGPAPSRPTRGSGSWSEITVNQARPGGGPGTQEGSPTSHRLGTSRPRPDLTPPWPLPACDPSGASRADPRAHGARARPHPTALSSRLRPSPVSLPPCGQPPQPAGLLTGRALFPVSMARPQGHQRPGLRWTGSRRQAEGEARLRGGQFTGSLAGCIRARLEVGRWGWGGPREGSQVREVLTRPKERSPGPGTKGEATGGLAVSPTSGLQGRGAGGGGGREQRAWHPLGTFRVVSTPATVAGAETGGRGRAGWEAEAGPAPSPGPGGQPSSPRSSAACPAQRLQQGAPAIASCRWPCQILAPLGPPRTPQALASGWG